jgi:hypothetical protein
MEEQVTNDEYPCLWIAGTSPAMTARNVDATGAIFTPLPFAEKPFRP